MVESKKMKGGKVRSRNHRYRKLAKIKANMFECVSECVMEREARDSDRARERERERERERDSETERERERERER